jgi:hypothetical protein
MADYIVTIRNKKGSLEERAYIAIDRADLFKKLAADGFTAVRVREEVLKNTTTKTAISKKSVITLVLIVCLLSVAFFLYYSNSRTNVAIEPVTTGKQLKTVKLSSKSESKPSSNVKTECPFDGGKGLTKANVNKSPKVNASEVSESNTNVVENLKKEDRRLFKNPMDQLLSMVMPKNLGDSVPPLPNIDNLTFTEEEENQLLERLTADDNDTDEKLERKKLVQAMRDEYRELKKNRSWSFVDYVKALQAKVDLDAEVLTESMKIHETVFNDTTISDAEYLKTLKKINDVLVERGIKPIGSDEESNEQEEK